MTFAYSQHLAALSEQGISCPPDDAHENDAIVWRWVKPSISVDCFAPQAVRNPQRFHRANELAEKCSCWGISMFETKEQGEKAFLALEKTVRRARKIFGGYIAKGNIVKTDGVCTPSNNRGHFDFHPRVSVDLTSKFSVVGEIK